MNAIVKTITPDGRVGFDKFDQLWAQAKPESDGTIVSTMISDVRGKECRICQRGWDLTADHMLDQARLNHWMVHRKCLEGYDAVQSFYEIQRAFIAAGYLFRMEEIPSQYPYSPPWQEIIILQNDTDRTPVAGVKVVVGRRKRVWEIQAHGFGDLASQFEDVDDTKGYATDPSVPQHYYIHAWTVNQLIRYLERIRMTIPLDTSRHGWVSDNLSSIYKIKESA